MQAATVFFGLVCSAAGAGLAAGKLHRHLAIWKAMNDQQRAQCSGLWRNLGGIIGLCGLILLANGLLNRPKLLIFSMLGWFVLAGLDLAWLERRSRRNPQPNH